MKSYPALVIRPARRDAAFGDLVIAALDGTDVTAVDEIDGAIRAFFASSESRRRAEEVLRRELAAATVEHVDVPDDNWAARSQAALRAVQVGDLTVAPPWDVPSDPRHNVVVILPSMGFGTGHHATTRLCLAALQRAGVAGRSVIDVGTGSGVLALAASKLGASRVLGVDNDADAIANALENKSLNGDPPQLEIRCASLDDRSIAAAAPFDFVVANLTGAVLVRFARALQSLGTGALILSGLREEEESSVASAFDGDVTARTAEDGWVCLVVGLAVN